MYMHTDTITVMAENLLVKRREKFDNLEKMSWVYGLVLDHLMAWEM